MNHTLLKHEKRNARRPGLTLLEVLISTFVLSIGLLGLLSLIPVGGYRVGQVNTFDRAATTGRHAFREFKTRGMLEPNRWMALDDVGGTNKYLRTWNVPNPWDDGTSTPYAGPEGPGVVAGDVAFTNVDDWAETFCIDPLFIARGTASHANDWPGRTFPYDLQITTSPFTLAPGDYDNCPRMPRVTLSMLEDFTTLNAGGWTSPSPPDAYSMVNSVAERIFMSQNDGIFDLPADEAETPVRLFSGGDADIEQYQGDYTWMAMVSRSPQEVLAVENPPSSGMYDDISPSIRNEYKVSIIVFAKRDFDTDVAPAPATPAESLASERICGIEFLNGLGLGGGDVAISAGPVGSVSAAEAEEYLDVSPNQWIMVCTWAPRPAVPPLGSYSTVYGQDRRARPVYRWYRVVATDKGPERVDVSGTEYWVRYLTLDGPDWDPNEFCNINGAAIVPSDLTDTYAVLVDGVVAVFERTIRREE